MKAVGITT